MKRIAALTIIEVLIVVAVISTLSIPLYFSYTRTQAHQSLRSSSEQLADTLRSARLFSREAKDFKAWGVKRMDEKTYALVGSPRENPFVEKVTTVESLVTIPQGFEVWFEIGTGNAQTDTSVSLENKYGRKAILKIYRTGIIDIETEY